MEESIVYYVGVKLAIVLWLVVVVLSLYKSIKKKQKVWIILLVLNFIAGIIIPLFFLYILPLIYLLIEEKRNSPIHKFPLEEERKLKPKFF